MVCFLYALNLRFLADLAIIVFKYGSLPSKYSLRSRRRVMGGSHTWTL